MIQTKLRGAARIVDYVSDVPRHRRGTTIQPRLLTHTVTFRCSAQCGAGCTLCNSSTIKPDDELGLEEIERFYRQLPRLDAVRLTGGEPFAREDFAEIAHLAADLLRPRMVHVTTHGLLQDRVVDLVKRWDRPETLRVLVSIDGLTSEDEVARGQAGSLEEAMSTLRALGPHRAQGRVRLAVSQTVSDREGARQYAVLREEMRRLDMPVLVSMAYQESATPEISNFLDELEADLELLPALERQAKAYYLAGLRRRLLGESGPSAPSCAALHAHLRLLSNGDIPTCQNNPKVIGNVRRAAFRDVWESAAATGQRRWVKACKGCWAECEVVPSALYTGELPAHALKSTFHPKIQRERSLRHLAPTLPRTPSTRLGLSTEA